MLKWAGNQFKNPSSSVKRPNHLVLFWVGEQLHRSHGSFSPHDIPFDRPTLSQAIPWYGWGLRLH